MNTDYNTKISLLILYHTVWIRHYSTLSLVAFALVILAPLL
jgi:hypothetical protein